MQAATVTAQERRRLRREERVGRVLDAAVSVFAERGFHDASMDEIADHAGVSKPVLYTHFESKDGLYAATLRRAGQLLTERVRASAAPDLSAEQRMWAGIVAFVDVVSEHREWWIVARKAAMGEGEFADLGRQMHDEMAELLRGLFVETAAQRGIVGGALSDVEPLAHAFVGACEAMALWWVERPGVPKGTVAMNLMNLMWMGFGDLVEGRLWLPAEARRT